LSGLKGTISVNNDQFFWTPMRPYECLAEQTCFQVPYDYVTATVYPDCATKNTCGTNWNANCQNRDCYGVPIYRQLLNQDENRGVGQSIRMAGTGTSQRNSMIYSNGVYYIDTASSAVRQNSPNLSLFEAGKGYNVFLVYAKPTTKVTFQVYVGPAFDASANLSMIRAGSQKTDGVVLVGSPEPGLSFTQGAWPPGWTKGYDASSNILTVTIDLTGSEFAKAFEDGKRESCKPSSFCTWNSSSKACQCTDPSNPSCQNEICEWSVKATECPSGGCYGFRFVLPAGFVADDNGNESESVHRPPTAGFLDASRRSSWCVPWDKVTQTGAGQASCTYDAANPPVCPE
jgi:hypothetical protein